MRGRRLGGGTQSGQRAGLLGVCKKLDVVEALWCVSDKAGTELGLGSCDGGLFSRRLETAFSPFLGAVLTLIS